jgi:DNA helicase-2/ATP-dependent DNA helicase PcrA
MLMFAVRELAARLAQQRALAFSYDKLLGGATLTKTDRDNASQGKETSIDRALRLFYVTCICAEESLALVLWPENTTGALASLSKCC